MNRRNGFRLGSLNHVHLRVPDRDEAAAWYAEHLGFERVDELDFWARGFDGGPLQITADGGVTTLALFEASNDHPMATYALGFAFSVDAAMFEVFARSLPGVLPAVDGQPLQRNDVIDFDLCWAYEFADPWANRFELNCFDYETVKRDVIDALGIEPQRYWPGELYDDYRSRRLSE